MALRRLAWVAGFFALVVCLGTSYASYLLADYSWNQVVEYRSPYADYERQWAQSREASSSAVEPRDPTAKRVVFVLIDGLTLEASRDLMNSLNTAREYGADMVAVTPQPSLSFPTWTNTVSGAPPNVSGVTTNWFEGQVPVETIFDSVYPLPFVVSAVEGFEELYGVSDIASEVHLEPWDDTKYLGRTLVDEAIRMSDDTRTALTFVYIPDADEIAHENGPESDEYAEVVATIDRDLQRLIAAMQDDHTLFVVTADHGHVDGGGHGGWEDSATHVPAVFFGPGARFDSGQISQSDIAPTIAAYLGRPVPASSTGHVLDTIVNVDEEAYSAAQAQYVEFAQVYAQVVDGSTNTVRGATTYEEVDDALHDVRAQRLIVDREARLPTALLVAGMAALVLLVLAVLSWRAFVAALAGTAVYYGAYNALYFFVHAHQWSLSAFNTESYVQTFFNTRMIETIAAGVLAATVAGLVYPLLRRRPRGPRKSYLGGWLSLGLATVLTIQATLVFQVAWFLWAWGAQVAWRLPDMKWAFKFDLDLIQITALAGAALLAPVVTYLVGRYHPKVRRTEASLIAEEPSGITATT